jgi:aryl-alcohol dehydrogenase-like predicted oxidoreductase
MSRATRFRSDDHRAYNRKGQAFDRGETFSGVQFARGLEAVEELRQIMPQGMSMSQFALRWILMNDAVCCAIPGAKRPEQVQENCRAADLPRLSRGLMRQVGEIYQRLIRDDVHHRW